MSRFIDCIGSLARHTPGGYQVGSPPAAEPTAWAAIALANHGEISAARRAADWLAELQSRDGSVGVTRDQPTPAWPTSLSMLAWLAVSACEYQANIRHAVEWSLEAKGRIAERSRQVGHDTTLVGWSWAADTHSWLEPTAMFVAALSAAGHAGHPRVREGVRLLGDRLLPRGGANYGNTRVLGQELLPHVQPTGLVLWALAGETIDDPRLPRAINYLEDNLTERTSSASLAFGLMGLAAQGCRPTAADAWLSAAARRELAGQASPYKLALLAAAGAAPSPQLSGVNALESSQ